MDSIEFKNFQPPSREIKFKNTDKVFRKDSSKKRLFEFLSSTKGEDKEDRASRLKSSPNDFIFDWDDSKFEKFQKYIWSIYFGKENFHNHEIKDIVELFKMRYKANQFKIDLKQIEQRNRIVLDYIDLLDPTYIMTLKKQVSIDMNRKEWQDIEVGFNELLNNKPRAVLKGISFLSHIIYLDKMKNVKEIERLCENERLRPITCRLINHNRITPIAKFKPTMIDTIITIHGTVVRASSLKPQVAQIEFVCLSCRRSQTVIQNDGKYMIPSKCSTQGCKGKNIQPERGIDSATYTIDSQTLRLQELKSECPEEDLGRVPRTLDCELTEELVDQVVPGDVVRCTGILKLRNVDESGNRFKASSTMHTPYLDVLHIKNATSQEYTEDDGSIDPHTNSKDKDLTEFSDRDLRFIEEVFNEPDLFRLIINSFCSDIYGHELVKFGILLALFGGRKRHSMDGAITSIRGDPHVLIVGDPGLGKSQMLSAAVKLAPRGVYVCASSGISTSGLTVTVVRESGSGDFALEAGALVLADQGCCCIDEFDKMASDHDALLEAMEQQSISIAKAGIVCSLPVRTSIIAAANPAGGHYNKGKTVSENLKMSGALLSRFDLVFILLDKPDEQMDLYLSKHVMRLHSGKKKANEYSFNHERPTISQNPLSDDLPLSSRIKLRDGEEMDLLNSTLLRKYIAYARTYVHPRLSKEAADILKNFYLELRANCNEKDATPITTRQLESLIRLAEARAKMELREVVTKEDATDVVELMKFSLYDSYMDNEGGFEIQRSQLGTGLSRKAQIKRFVTKLTQIANETFTDLFTYNRLYQVAQEMNLNLRMDFRELIDSLNHHGYLLKKGNDTYKITTSEI